MVAARAELPDDTVIDDEVVALDEPGKPSFDPLQGLGNRVPPIVLYGFDLLMLRGRDVRLRPLDERRDELREAIKHVGSVSIEYSRYWSKSTSKAQLSPGSSLAPTMSAQVARQSRPGVCDRRLCSEWRPARVNPGRIHMTAAI
jgi:hypothetical protein